MIQPARDRLIDLLHLGSLLIFKLWKVVIIVIIDNVILINGQTQLDHAVNAGSKGGGLIQGEARGKHRGVEKEPDEVLDSLVILVLLGTGTESLNDSMAGVKLHGLL